MTGHILIALFGAIVAAVLSDTIADIDHRENNYQIWIVLASAIASAVGYQIYLMVIAYPS